MDKAGTDKTSARDLIKLLIRMSRLHKGILEHDLKDTGVYRSQHQILMAIAMHPGISQKEVARYHHSSPATVAVSLKKLEKGGYIRRIVNDQDNRYNRIEITPRGQEIVSQSRRIFEQVEQDSFRGLSDQELAVMGHCLMQMCANLEAHMAKRKGGKKDGD